MTLGVNSLRVLSVVVVAAAIAATATGVVVIKQSNRLDSIERRIGSGTLDQVAWEADRDVDNRHFALVSGESDQRVEGVLTEKNAGFLLRSTLGDASSGKVYQVWAETSAGVISLGLAGEDFADPVSLRIPETATSLFVTEEMVTGATVPAAKRVVSGPVPVWS